MQLLIVRHAIAEERNARRWPSDLERPVSARGRSRAKRAAQGLQRLAPRPLQVLTSPLARAQQTAQILRRHASWPEALVCEPLKPGGSPEALLTLLAQTRAPCVAVVGHEPDLGRLIAASLKGAPAADAIGLRKMGAALLQFAGRAHPKGGRLVWLLTPSVLRAVRHLRKEK
jgi:phosphohistidine phosphatase